MAGYQSNADVEIASANDLPSTVPAGIADPGDDVELDESGALSLAVDFVYGQDQTKRMGFYLSHQQTRFDSDAGLIDDDLDITHLHFTSMIYYPRGNWEPFALAGLGAGHFSPKDTSLKDTTRFSAQLGVGTNYRFSENLLLRLDARWFATFFSSSESALCSGGCTIAISSEVYTQVQANIGLMYRF